MLLHWFIDDALVHCLCVHPHCHMVFSFAPHTQLFILQCHHMTSPFSCLVLLRLTSFITDLLVACCLLHSFPFSHLLKRLRVRVNFNRYENDSTASLSPGQTIMSRSPFLCLQNFPLAKRPFGPLVGWSDIILLLVRSIACMSCGLLCYVTVDLWFDLFIIIFNLQNFF